MAMKTLTHFFLGLTNEWLESMSTIIQQDGGGNEKTDNSQGSATAPKDSFPIQVSQRMFNFHTALFIHLVAMFCYGSC